MKRLALFTVVFGLAFSAAAQTPAADPADAAATPATSATEDADVSAKQAAKDELADRNCLKHTGSRLIRADRDGRKCAMASGRSYTREDLERTGARDMADALRMLDTSIR